MGNSAGYALEVNIGGGDALEANIGDVRMLPGKDGADGQDGITPTIGENGNWYLGATDTGKPSRGADGATGATGATGEKGTDGKSAYQYAVDGGYTGTEAEFAAKLAEKMPTALPNPNALTFTGAVTGSYDGSKALTIEIPSSGGEIPKPLTYDYMPVGYPTKALGTVTVMEERELAFRESNGDVSGYYGLLTTTEFEIIEGQTYKVKWDGTEYECVCSVIESTPALGNLSIMGVGDDTGEPFLFSKVGGGDIVGYIFYTLDTSATHTVGIKTTAETTIPMSEEFIPNMNVSAFTNDAGYLTLATLPKYGGEVV